MSRTAPLDRSITLVPAALLALLALGGWPAHAEDPTEVTLATLNANSDHAKEVKRALAILKKYYIAELKVENPKAKTSEKQREAGKQNEAFSEFETWLRETPERLGFDLRKHPGAIVELLDEGRLPALKDRLSPSTPRKGQIDYIEGNGRGIERDFFYAVEVPKDYKPENPALPLVVCLHDRVINQNHPALKRDPTARGAVVIYNSWKDTPTEEHAIFIAPTSDPTGFTFKDSHGDELKLFFRALGAGLTHYRTDWNRVFLEVSGSAVRLACEQAFMFAGCIVRDREDDRRDPILSPDEFFMLENLNGMPFCYIADEKYWDRVGQPFAKALEEAYAKAGKPENLLVLKGKRDVNGGLKADPAQLDKFVTTHRRATNLKSFTWRHFNDDMINPLPVWIVSANFLYPHPQVPLAKKAGALKFKVSTDVFKDNAGNDRPYSKVEVDITEAEEITVFLHDGYVNLDNPVSLIVNGETVIDKQEYQRNWNRCLGFILPRRFFMYPFVAEMNARIKLKPQYVPPPPKEEPAEGQPPGETPPEEKPPEEDASKNASAGADGAR